MDKDTKNKKQVQSLLKSLILMSSALAVNSQAISPDVMSPPICDPKHPASCIADD